MGEYKCDTPAGLAQSLLRSISIENRFSIFTGDVIEGSPIASPMGKQDRLKTSQLPFGSLIKGTSSLKALEAFSGT
jgi:hypothetical protein